LESNLSGDNLTLLTRLTHLGQKLPPELKPLQADGVPAAVLAPLVLPHWQSPREEAKLLFIKRSEDLKKHAGQMAFPGGVVEHSDPDVLSAGFREGYEEVGLQRENTKLLAELPWAFTPSGFSLHPYFVATTQQQFVAQAGEVESIHLIAVEELMNCPVRLEYKVWAGTTYRVIYFDTNSACIWGVTGRITEVLLTHFFQWEAPQ
jgi:8-oxo-dGTP pyrophosphatase MutT (NUDIX family)